MFAKWLARPTARRTFSPRSVFALAALGALLLSTALLSASAATPATESSNLDIVYDSGTARLSLNARLVPLQIVLNELSRLTPLTIRHRAGEWLREEISFSIDDSPLDEAMRELLKDHGWVFIDESLRGDTSGAPAGSVAGTLIVLSKKAKPPLRPVAGQAKSAPKVTDDWNTAPQRLIDALLVEDGLIGELMRLTEAEREWAAEAVRQALETRNLATYGQAMKLVDALHALDPDNSTLVMGAWLEADRQQLRLLAARGLARVGGESAVPLLVGALAWGDAPLRQAAANGLARIGGNEATDILVESYRSDRFELQLMAASAVAYHGNATCQKALAEQILRSPLPENRSAKDVIVGYLSQAEENM